MDQRSQAFRDARDGASLALGGAFASTEEARRALERLATAVDDRAEVDALRGAIELVAYAIEGLALAVAQIELDGGRSRPKTPWLRNETSFSHEIAVAAEQVLHAGIDPIADPGVERWVIHTARSYETDTGAVWDRLLREIDEQRQR